jgi:hypothetical protein
MTNIFKSLFQRQRSALIIVSWLTMLSGCAELLSKAPEPVTVAQVIQMSKEGTPAEVIVKRMHDSEAVYRLTAAQLAELHDLGVADRVLNYMQDSYIEAARREQSRQDWGDWNMSWPGLW